MVRGTASYFDGESAARRAVDVELATGGVRILETEPGARELAFWPYRTIRAVDERTDDGPIRIRTATGRGRLVVESPALIAALAGHAPRLAGRAPGWNRLALRWVGLLALSIAVLLGTLRYALPRFAEETAHIMPYQWEMDFGESLVEPVLRAFARLDDIDEVAFCTAPGGVESLAALTRRLAPAESPYRFVVRVVNLEMVNAFALPGGQILIAEGLLRAAESPDEVAGVLAHEMGHVLHRHATAGVVEALGLAFLFGVLLGEFGTGVVGGAGETLVGLSFRREAEAEADERALVLLEHAGLGSRGLVDFFERMQRRSRDGPAVLRLLSTHPPNEVRRRTFERGATARPPSLDKAAWTSLKTICRRQQPLDPE